MAKPVQAERERLIDGLSNSLIFGGAQESMIYPIIAKGRNDWELFGFAIGALGDAQGDDERAATLLRETYKEYAGTSFEQACLIGLVKRVGHSAIRDLRDAWTNSKLRESRGVALAGLGYLGVADYFSQVLPLYNRAVKNNQRSSGGIDVLYLMWYVFACAGLNDERCLELKRVIRSNWPRIEPQMHRRFTGLLPGIEDESRLIADINLDSQSVAAMFDIFRRPEDRMRRPRPRAAK